MAGKWPVAPSIYQIYPRSFRDTTGSGVGDLNGITEKLDVIAALGVDAIWLSPIFLSPFKDGGYDIIDHCTVDPRFGTMEDFEALVKRAHDLDLLVMLDQVHNHTSDQNPVFQAAIAGDDEAAAHYVWRDPKPDGSPPNNWLSQFGGPAWTWNHKRRQYYMHQFLPSQPSVDMRCPGVQKRQRDEMQFWRDKGVDGFRFDVVTAFLFDPGLGDNPPASPEVHDKVAGANFNPYTYQDHTYDILTDESALYTEKLRSWAGEEMYLLGESQVGNHAIELAMTFTGKKRLDAVYTTDLPEGHGDAKTLANVFSAKTDLCRFGGWLTCHDQPRIPRDQSMGRFYGLLMGALPGPWLIYQGEELGLHQPELQKDEVTDPYDLLYWPDGPGREGPRVPLPWEADAENFGFTTGTPWLPMRWQKSQARDHPDAQVLATFYSEVLEKRRTLGWDLAKIEAFRQTGEVLCFTMATKEAAFTVVANYSDTVVPALKSSLILASEETGVTVPPRCVAVYEGDQSAEFIE